MFFIYFRYNIEKSEFINLFSKRTNSNESNKSNKSSQSIKLNKSVNSQKEVISNSNKRKKEDILFFAPNININTNTNKKIENSFNVKDIFNTATLNGAKSYGINAGEIKEGKLADFVLYNLNHYLLLPNYNLLSNLVYSAQNDCITDVFCDGVQLMKDRKVENEQRICEEFRIVSEKFKNLDNSSNINC